MPSPSPQNTFWRYPVFGRLSLEVSALNSHNIYPLFWNFGIIAVPDIAKVKMTQDQEETTDVDKAKTERF